MAFVDYKNDIVNICPNDTIGDVVVIDNLKIQLPEKPPRNKFINYGKPLNEQTWNRAEVPEALASIESMDEWNEQTKEFKLKFEPYINEEFRRRKEGVWILIGGRDIYLTGKHYFFLQWSKFDFGYPFFIEPQWELWIHCQACLVDPRCFGQVHVKNRRAGWSSISTSETQEEATRVKDSNFGLMSKTNEDAKDVLFKDKIVGIYRSLPFFFRPISDSPTDPKTELTYRSPSSRKRKNKSFKTKALNNKIDFRATKTNSYDGSKLRRIIEDEAGKFEKPANIEKHWQVIKKCLIDRTKIIGKCMMGSTVNPSEKGGKEFKKVYYASDVTKRNSINGRTESGLYSIFIPAYRTVVLDKFGFSVIEDPESPIETIDGEVVPYGGKTFLLSQRQQLSHDPEKLAEEQRQMPFSLDEAFMDYSESSAFNLVKIKDQLFHNNHLMESQSIYRTGRFEWKDGIRFSQPVFRATDNKDDPWQLAWVIPENDRYGYEKVGNVYKPKNSWLGVAGVDPYKLDTTTDSRNSKASMHIVSRVNAKYKTPKVFARYNNREQTAVAAYEQMLMGAMFYGVPMLIENNVWRMIDKMLEWGFEGFIMECPKHLRPKSSRKKGKQYGIPMSSEDSKQAHAFTLQTFVEDNVGFKVDGDMNDFAFNETLKDLASFDINNRTKHDDSISLGIALIGLQVVPSDENKVYKVKSSPLRKYKYGAGNRPI